MFIHMGISKVLACAVSGEPGCILVGQRDVVCAGSMWACMLHSDAQEFHSRRKVGTSMMSHKTELSVSCIALASVIRCTLG